MKTITLNCFGPAKQFTTDGNINLEVENEATIDNVRNLLSEWLSNHPLKTEMQEILAISVFATQNKILHEEESIQENTELAIIPPMNGG